MAKRAKRQFWFLNNEQALVFAAKVNGRREAIRHYETALSGERTPEERAFLTRSVERLKAEVAELMA